MSIEADVESHGSHPALVAWRTLRGAGGTPIHVSSITSKEKASVWRLTGAAPSGADVIAKRATRGSAAIERLIYERVIPRVGVDSPAYFGSVEDGDDAIWLFVEDAGDEPFSYDDAEQRTMAAVWLARLHTCSQGLNAAVHLPDRGPAHFRQRLDDAVHTLQARLAGESDATSRDVVERLLEQCALLANRWQEIDEFCARLPLTIVHGDFAALNIRIRGGGIVAFDWEKAGVGVPIIDIARGLDLEAYWRGVQPTWPDLTIEDVQRMASVARVFRPLSHNWARKTLEKLRDHYIHMEHTIQTMGWSAKAEALR